QEPAPGAARPAASADRPGMGSELRGVGLFPIGPGLPRRPGIEEPGGRETWSRQDQAVQTHHLAGSDSRAGDPSPEGTTGPIVSKIQSVMVASITRHGRIRMWYALRFSFSRLSEYTSSNSAEEGSSNSSM